MGPPTEQTLDLTVADLMCSGGLQWNRERIQLILPFYEDRILSIKQSVTGAPDRLMWLGTKTGEYSVKSGYYTAVEDDAFGAEAFMDPNFNWTREVWNLDCAPKVKLFAWKVLKGALPVGERLVERHVPVDPQCKRCGCTESITHLLFHCPFARKVWRLAPLVNEVECSGMIDLVASWKDMCANRCLPPSGITTGPLFLWIIWNLWKSRNRFVFEGFYSSPEDVLTAAIVVAREWSTERKQEKVSTKGRIRLDQQRPFNTIVVKTDAAWDALRQAAGLGWFLQSNSQNKTYKERVEFVSSPLMAEALALRIAVLTCRRLKMKRVCFESDSAQLIKIVNSGSGALDLHGVASDIISCIPAFVSVCFVWIPRERNTDADLLAKSALNAPGQFVVDGVVNALS